MFLLKISVTLDITRKFLCIHINLYGQERKGQLICSAVHIKNRVIRELKLMKVNTVDYVMFAGQRSRKLICYDQDWFIVIIYYLHVRTFLTEKFQNMHEIPVTTEYIQASWSVTIKMKNL